MTSWLTHPKLSSVREQIIKSLTPAHYRFKRVSPVVFICGGFNSNPRDTLRNYLHRKHPELGLFYAEKVWEAIATNPGLGALRMESELAALSDLVVIVVESPGTFAELGAFSHVDSLRKKLLPILDLEFRNESSFINTGPIRWIDTESDFGPAIWVHLDRILLCAKEIEAKIENIPPPKPVKLTDLAESRKHLLFFLCDLVAVIAPATVKTIEYFLSRIISTVPVENLEVPMLVGLGEAMRLLRKDVVRTGHAAEETFFSPASPDALEHPYHRIKWVNLPGLRSEYASKLLDIPDAVEVMREVSSHR